MISCISEYFSYYFNYYFNSIYSNIEHIENTNKNIDLNIDLNISYHSNKILSSLEIEDSYELLFSIHKNSPKNIELLFYNIYSKNESPKIIESRSSKIFKYDNKLFKINHKKNYKQYISIIHRLINHKSKNIIIPEEIYYNKSKNNQYIEIFPYYPDGDLFSYIENTYLTNTEKFNIFNKLVDIIHELHKINITHRDIKPENFLVEIKNNQINIKLTDLEFSSIATRDLKFHGGTLHYASYELINFQNFTSWFSSDIWSLTVILYILLFNIFPWKNTLAYKTYDTTKLNYKPCEIFNDYINSNPYDYWYKYLSTLFNTDDKYFTIYLHLLTYGFNINWHQRTEISYIKHVLNTVQY